MTGPPRGPLLALLTLLALVLGMGTGLASVALHEKSWLWLALALAAPAATTAALPSGWLRSGFGLGWLGLVLVAFQARPEGDFLVLASPRGYTLFGFGLALLIAVVVTLPVRRATHESGSATFGT